MLLDVVLGKFSATMTEGVVAEWQVGVGDSVEPGTLLCSVEIDKTTMDIESEWTGEVAAILASTGDTVPVGGAIAQIRTAD